MTLDAPIGLGPVAAIIHAQMRVVATIKLLRPKQWSKNLLVFAALLFTGTFSQAPIAMLALMAFAAMCLLSSSTYIVNDLLDLERDRAHPVKKSRPLASGTVSPGLAIVLAILLAAGAFAIGWSLNKASLALLILYALMQGAYNVSLKRTPVADVFVIAIGFILRATLGAAAIGVTVSPWLLFCTGALALMLGFGKRRHEYALQGEERAKSRESLAGYSIPVLDALVIISASGAAQCYALYSIESTTAKQYRGLLLTSLFVFYGIARYVYLIFSRGEGGEPESLLFKDRHILLTVAGFVLVTILAVRGMQIPMLIPPGK